MTISSKVGVFATGTGAVSSTVVVSGVGFQPKAIIFWWSRATAATDEISAVTCAPGTGYAASTTQRCAYTAVSEDAQAASDTATVYRSDACVVVYAADATVDGYLDLSSLDADGFTLVVRDQFATSYRISYLALGGSSITNAAVGTRTAPTALGNEVVTGVGFQPDVVLFLGQRAAVTSGTSAANANFAIGAMTSGGQGTAAAGAPSAAATMESARYGVGMEAISIGNVSATWGVGSRASRVSLDADGYTLNWLEVASATVTYSYLAIRGGSWIVGDLLTQANTTTPIVETGFGFAPAGALLFSHGTAQSAQNGLNASWSTSIGAFTSPTERAAQATWMQDATADSETALALEYDAVYARISATDTIEGLMDVQSVDSDGFTLIMDDADPAQAYVTYVAFGPADTGAAPLDPAGIVAGAAAGSPTLAPGAVTTAPAGVAPVATAGAPALAPGPATLAATGVAPQSSAGAPALAPGPVALSPAGLASSSTAGAPAVAPGAVVLAPAGVALAASVGAPALTPGAVALAPAGLAAQSSPGAPSVTAAGSAFLPAGVAAVAAAGSPALAPGAVALSPEGLASQSTVGSPALAAAGAVVLTPAGAAAQSDTGAPALAPGPVAVAAAGIATQSATGEPLLDAAGAALLPAGVATQSAAGAPVLAPGPVTLAPAGCSPQSSVGAPDLAGDRVTAQRRAVVAPIRFLAVAPRGRAQPAPAPARALPVAAPARARGVAPRLRAQPLPA